MDRGVLEVLTEEDITASSLADLTLGESLRLHRALALLHEEGRPGPASESRNWR